MSWGEVELEVELEEVHAARHPHPHDLLDRHGTSHRPSDVFTKTQRREPREIARAIRAYQPCIDEQHLEQEPK